MKTYIALMLLVLTLALAGCPKEEPKPVDNPNPAVEKTEGLGAVEPGTD